MATLALPGCHVEGCLSPGLRQIDIGPVLQQNFGHVDEALERRLLEASPHRLPLRGQLRRLLGHPSPASSPRAA